MSFGLALAGQAAGQATTAMLGMALGRLNANWQDKRQLKQQEKLQRMQISGQKEMMNYQQQQAYDMWLKTGPEAQKNQLKEAGLNPALMYGMGGAGGGTMTAPSGNVSGGQAAGGSGEVAQMMGLMLQNKMTASQIKVNEAQAENIAADTEKKKGVDTTKVKTEIENLIQGTKNAAQQNRLMEIQEDYNNLELELKEATFNDAINKIYQESKIATRMAEKATRENRIGDATEQTAINSIRLQYATLAAQKAAIEAGTSNTNMDTQLKSNQINAILKGIQQKWFEIELKGREVGETEERNRIAQASQELQEQLGIPKAMIDTIIGVLIGKGLKQ